MLLLPSQVRTFVQTSAPYCYGHFCKTDYCGAHIKDLKLEFCKTFRTKWRKYFSSVSNDHAVSYNLMAETAQESSQFKWEKVEGVSVDCFNCRQDESLEITRFKYLLVVVVLKIEID